MLAGAGVRAYEGPCRELAGQLCTPTWAKGPGAAGGGFLTGHPHPDSDLRPNISLLGSLLTPVCPGEVAFAPGLGGRGGEGRARRGGGRVAGPGWRGHRRPGRQPWLWCGRRLRLRRFPFFLPGDERQSGKVGAGAGRLGVKAPPGQLGQNSGGRKEGHRQAAACWRRRGAAQPGVPHTSWDTSVTSSFLRRPPRAAGAPRPPRHVLGIPGAASALPSRLCSGLQVGAGAPRGQGPVNWWRRVRLTSALRAAWCSGRGDRGTDAPQLGGPGAQA